ncbi:MAG: group II intron maturase-specific domain-containing protein [Polaromonas sp.]
MQRRLIYAQHKLSEAAVARAYFGITEVLSPLREIDKWVRRRLRCYAWKQWGSAGYRDTSENAESRVREAWNTSKSAHGPWRLSQTPALTLALPLRFFRQLGLPELATAKAV